MTKELLIKILSEWSIAHLPGNYDLTAKDNKYSVEDFMHVTSAIFNLKGIKGETITINSSEVENSNG